MIIRVQPKGTCVKRRDPDISDKRIDSDGDGLAARSSRPRFLLGLASVQSRQGDGRAARETLQRILDDAEYLPKYAKREARPWLRKARQALKRLGSGEVRAAV